SPSSAPACTFSDCGYADPRDLRSFPTRRSSDLFEKGPLRRGQIRGKSPVAGGADGAVIRALVVQPPPAVGTLAASQARGDHHPRSEEHTSELQSRENLVCRLLLEKKKRSKSDYD